MGRDMKRCEEIKNEDNKYGKRIEI